MRSLNLITEKNFDYLNIPNPKEARLYLLPKIHKKDIPGRPICSSIQHPTAHISKFVDEHIKKYVPKTRSYVRDTQHFISRLKQLGQIPTGALLVTLDVSSLYTNIPNHEGLQAVADHLRTDPEKQKIGPHLLKLLQLVLHSMSFSFNGDHYLQIGGTAMGTAVAPNYANLFMDRFETKALENWPLKPLLWLRFIDDIFMIWTHGEDALTEFIEYLNGIHPTIKFTHEVSPTSINFLDTTVKLNENRELYTTLYEKPTDTHLYLHYTSSHHTPSKTKGPYGQFLRLRRICTYDDDFDCNQCSNSTPSRESATANIAAGPPSFSTYRSVGLSRILDYRPLKNVLQTNCKGEMDDKYFKIKYILLAIAVHKTFFALK